MRKWVAIMAAALATLSACQKSDDPGQLTDADNRQLDNAAEMLDASPDSLTAEDDQALGNGDEAVDADNAAAPDGGEGNGE